MKLKRAERRRSPESTIALINVVFLLLIFFMLAGQIRLSAPFEVRPPASDSEAAAARGPATLAIGSDGQLALNGAPVTRETLPDAFDDGVPARLRLKADAEVPAARLIALMTDLRGRGVQKLSLLTVRSD